MAELIINGHHDSQHLRLSLEQRRMLVLGRGERADLAVPWDLLISRQHAQIRWISDKLQVRKLESGRNAIFFRGRECQEFELALGEEFQIGKTTFRFEAPPETADPQWPPNHAGLEMLSNGSYKNASRWLEVLARLPDTISQSNSDEDFAQCVVSMILEALPRVDTAAVLHLMGMGSGTPSHLRMLCWDGRETEMSNFQISRTIVKESLERRDGLIHIWDSDPLTGQSHSDIQYTNSGQFDWTFCVPITQGASWGWCLYMSGFLDCDNMPILKGREELHEELRFVELLAQFIGALRELRLLENRKEGLKQFFSPAIRDNVSNAGGDSVLRPRDSDISVLFCQFRRPAIHNQPQPADLRKMSRIVDQNFRAMSQGVFAEHGVMADFQGDSSMAFWGWPVPTNDGPLPACRAALALRRAQLQHKTLGHSRLICGIAHGPGMAGKIGPEDQCKMGVFGHVVNLGARLKSMARQLKSGILIDAATAEYVREHLPPTEGRCRKIGYFRPHGMEKPSLVHELLLPAKDDPAITDSHLEDFETAVELISRGDWLQAKKLLHSLPSEDPCKHFLVLMIAIHDDTPPTHWDGVFSLLGK